MARKTVQYFFSFISPFAALADARIDDLVARSGAVLTPIPLVPPGPTAEPTGLAAQLQEFKVSYLLEDARRWAGRLGLPWNPPPRAPLDSADAAAGWYLARERGCERGYRNAVFRARWGLGRDIGDREVLADCAEQAGLPRAELLEALRSKRYRDEVPKTLALAVRERIFGVPIFVVAGKRFWGNDRIDFLLEELASGAGAAP